MIPAAALDFLRALAANNDRAWFEANRAAYESDLRAPITALIGPVAAALARRGVPLEGEPKRSLFRIHRDVRFSKDKRPYKTNAGAVWYRQGSGKTGAGVLYFHLDPAGCFAAAAFYMPQPEVLDAIRERIRVHPERFLEVEAALHRAKLTLADADRLSRMPKGFEDLKASPVAAALRLKSFIVRRPLPVRTVTGRGLAEALATLAEDALPLLRFGWDAVDEVARG